MTRLFLVLFLFSTYANATSISQNDHHSINILWFGILIAVSIFSFLAKKYRQSAVLGQLLIGSLIGVLAHFHVGFFSELLKSQEIGFIALLGSIFLLFEIGIESDFDEIKTTGKHAIQVAIIGVIVPFCLGYFIVTPYILNSNSYKLALFIGGILAVTSTSISVSVFKELGIIRLKACQIVLSASVIDDIIGLILLSVIASIISLGSISSHLILFSLSKVILFFIISYILGSKILPKVFIPYLSKIETGKNISTLFMVSFCFIMAWFADILGLSHVIGAFVAGLMLKLQDFSNHKLLPAKVSHDEHNEVLLDLIRPLSNVLTPIFFIYAGMQVDLVNAFNLKTILIAFGISFFAIIGKLCCCVTLPKTINKLIIGIGMVPRGEIGIIFAITGLTIGIIDNELFTTLLLVVVITSIFTPLALNKVIRKTQTSMK